MLFDEYAPAFPQLSEWQVPSMLLRSSSRSVATQEEPEQEVTFFKNDQLPPGTRMSSRKGRPSPMGEGITRTVSLRPLLVFCFESKHSTHILSLPV